MTDRYARQMTLPAVGPEGQARLGRCHVLVVGAGGLGSHVLLALAGAGIGRLTIVDDDRVEITNLHRQPLYRMADIGQPKAESARDALALYNPEVSIGTRVERLRPGNAAALAAEADIVVDAADSLAVTYILSDACRAAATPFVTASVLEQRGYAGAFCGGAPSYRAVFPDMPSTVGSCAANGVLGSAVGVIGSLEAHLALGIALGASPSPLGRLISIDLATFKLGGFRFDGTPEPNGPAIAFIEPGDVTGDDIVIELRDEAEAPEPALPQAIRLDPTAVAEGFAPPAGRRVVFCCRSGIRAHRAARLLERREDRPLAVIAAGA